MMSIQALQRTAHAVRGLQYHTWRLAATGAELWRPAEGGNAVITPMDDGTREPAFAVYSGLYQSLVNDLGLEQT
jgi:hypothetical protein